MNEKNETGELTKEKKWRGYEIGFRYIAEKKYWNTNNFAIAVVARVTAGIDWAAYIAATEYDKPEKFTVHFAADHGAKLAEEDARHFFPELKDLRYRH